MSTTTAVRLWSRLATGRFDSSGDAGTDEYAVLVSVREHLGWLLNAHRGDSPACPGFGLPDLSGIIASLPKSENAFCAALRSSISEYEPRISHVTVRLVNGDETGAAKVHFTIEISIKASAGGSKRQFDGAVNIDNVFTVG